MDRILVLPMAAPHTNMWYTNAGLSRSEMVPMDQVLDVDLIESGLDSKRVLVLKETVEEFHDRWRHKKWLVYTKPQSRTTASGETKNNWLSENAIKFKFRKKKEDFIFWNKGSMWMCCSGGELMTKYIAFNANLLRVVQNALERNSATSRGSYNAIHVRRADGHTRADRRTASHYYDAHLTGFDASLPLYVATDEKSRAWFDPLIDDHNFARLIFYGDFLAMDEDVSRLIEGFPASMRGDAVGFVDQIVCCLAESWEGSDGSTFSFAIAGMRKHNLCRGPA